MSVIGSHGEREDDELVFDRRTLKKLQDMDIEQLGYQDSDAE